jgi:hypothetical protein
MTVIGAVWALSATIGGKLDMHHAKLTNEGGSALVLDQIQIKGEAHLDPVTVTGAIQALGATIVGALYLQGATLTNKGGIALKLDRAEIKGDVLLNPVTVTGAVHAVGATITGVLNLQGASLTNPGGTALELGRADWAEIAEQVGLTVSGAWSRYRRARPPKPPALGRWQQVLADALDQNLAIGVRAAVTDHLGRAPTRAELTAARRAAHGLDALGRARVLHVPGADGNDNAGDRAYLVLAKPPGFLTRSCGLHQRVRLVPI